MCGHLLAFWNFRGYFFRIFTRVHSVICHFCCLTHLKKNYEKVISGALSWTSNGLDPDQVRRSFGPDLGSKCLQMLSADDNSPLARKEFMSFWSFLSDNCYAKDNCFTDSRFRTNVLCLDIFWRCMATQVASRFSVAATARSWVNAIAAMLWVGLLEV